MLNEGFIPALLSPLKNTITAELEMRYYCSMHGGSSRGQARSPPYRIGDVQVLEKYRNTFS